MQYIRGVDNVKRSFGPSLILIKCSFGGLCKPYPEEERYVTCTIG